MRAKWMQSALLLAGMAAFGVAIADAQTDVAASLYGAFTGTTTGTVIMQSPSNAAGGLLELRHIRNPIIGYEGTYSFNRANETFALSSANPCPPGGCPPAAAVLANAHEVTADWVVSVKAANLRPFALAGAGLLFDVPSSGQIGTRSNTKPVFVYGAGVDWGLLPHLGLRFQFRGNLYKAPNLATLYGSTGAFTRTSEPMIGVYFRL